MSLQKIFSLFLITFLSASFRANAGSGDLVQAERIFSFDDQPGLYLLLGKRETSEALKYHVFKSDHGNIVELNVKQGSSWDESSGYIELENGMRLFAPNTDRDNIFGEKTKPYLMYKFRAREALTEISITTEILESLEFDSVSFSTKNLEQPAQAQKQITSDPRSIQFPIENFPAKVIPYRNTGEALAVLRDEGQPLSVRLDALRIMYSYSKDLLTNNLDPLKSNLEVALELLNELADRRTLRSGHFSAEALESYFLLHLKILKHLGEPWADRLFFILASKTNGAAASMVDGNSLDMVLQWKLRLITEGERLSPMSTPAKMAEENWKLSGEGVIGFEHIEVAAKVGDLYLWNQDNANQFLYGHEAITSLPFKTFGLKADDRTAKKKIINFIIAAESSSAESLSKLAQIAQSNPQTFAPEGSAILVSLIRGLASTSNELLAVRDFDPQIYYANVIDIFVELFESSDYILKNKVTYLALLDAAVGLQERINAEQTKHPINPALAAKSYRLSNLIQRNLIAPLRELSKSPEALNAFCEHMLAKP